MNAICVQVQECVGLCTWLCDCVHGCVIVYTCECVWREKVTVMPKDFCGEQGCLVLCLGLAGWGVSV